MGKRLQKFALVSASALTIAFGSVGFVGQKSAKAYSVSDNNTLDNRVIFQSFSLYQPYESNMYSILSSKGQELKDLGITDVWLPPGYRSFNEARYMEGYAIADRYDLGQFDQGPNGTQPTKYGTSDQLKTMVNDLHTAGLKVQEDLVPNQMLGLQDREAVYVTRVDGSGNLFKNPFTTGTNSMIRADLYLAYTKGGGQGQATYGYIKQWNKNYFNGTSLQGQGIGRVMTDPNGVPYQYYGPNDSRNYIPAWLDDAAAANKINTVDTYLPVDGWYAAKDAATSDNYWKPMLMNYSQDTGYLPFMQAHGYATVDDIINGNNGDISNFTNQYINSQPQYGMASEEPSFENDNSGIDDMDQLMFVNQDGTAIHQIHNTIGGNNEFLVGLDIDNSNPTVQKEQVHWMNWLLDTYNFDGFRIDAASNYDKQILLDENDVMKQHFGTNLTNNLSYAESYEGAAKTFENANGNPQLTMDYSLFYTLENTLGKGNNTNAQPLSSVETNSTVNRTGAGSKDATPNWSFVMNHDQEKNKVNSIMEQLYGITPRTVYGSNTTPQSFNNLYDKATEKKALQMYENDMTQTNKKYAPTNVVSQYAYILTNKDTVPTVYYGDMYQTDGSYMATKTLYYDPISKLLQVRKNYAYGDQYVTNYTSNTSPKKAGQDLIASVRYGTNRNNGVATVIGDNPALNTTIVVKMGQSHANQEFKDATGYTTQTLRTDSNGNLKIPVKGVANPYVKGYLGVWIPTNNQAPSLTWNAGSILYQGNTTGAEIKVANETSPIKSETFSSSNKSIATVTNSGIIKGGAKTGKVTITATVALQDGTVIKGSKLYTLVPNQVTFKSNGATLKRGQTVIMAVQSSSDKVKTVYYKTSNSRVAIVTSNGKITAKYYGKATITAYYTLQDGYHVTKQFLVTVK